jgi:NTP pyrophosphatase (non-canonical NTP hydrolase)
VPLTVLVTSPRVAPGLMSWAAWSAVACASRRLARSADLPLARSVAEAGHPVGERPSGPDAGLLASATDTDVVWLASPDEVDRLPDLLAPGGEVPVAVVHGSYDVPGARLLDLVAVMDRLRRECPWDRQQTHRSLAPYLLEETYETLEAVESGDLQHLREELGDLLLQVVFHARVAAEAGASGFTVDDVATGIVDKLVHRHPHVFAGLEVADAEEVDRNWEDLKAAEKGRASVLDGVPLALPALALADKVLGRAARAGVAPGPADGSLGDRLLALVVTARAGGEDAEQALRAAVSRLAATVRAAEVPSAT